MDETGTQIGVVGEEIPEGRKRAAWVASKIVSGVINPLMMPLYATMILLFGNSVVSSHVPVKLKIYFTAVIALNTVIIPGLLIGLLKTFGYIQDYALSVRRERILPLIITAVCYIVCAFMISKIYVAFLIHKFLISGLACVATALVITTFWKVSIHMTAIGGLLAMLVLMNISDFGSFYWAMIAVIMLCGVVASARLYLGAHTPFQVLSGFVLGFGVTSFVLLVPWG